jgi:hypothetical protein
MLKGFLNTFDSNVDVMLDKIHPKRNANNIGTFFITFFDKFIAKFVSIYGKKSDSEKKTYLKCRMTGIFKKSFEMMVFSTKGFSKENYSVLKLLIFNKEVFLPFILDSYRYVLENPEIDNQHTVGKLSNVIQFILKDPVHFSALHWILPNLKSCWVDNLVDKDSLLQLFLGIFPFFGQIQGYKILIHLESLKDTIYELALFIFRDIVEVSDRNVMLDDTCVGVMWDLGKTCQEEVFKIVEVLLATDRWTFMEDLNLLSLLGNLYHFAPHQYSPLLVEFIKKNILIKPEDFVESDPSFMEEVLFKYKIEIEYEFRDPSGDESTIGKFLSLITIATTVPRILDDPELFNLVMQCILLGMQRKSGPIADCCFGMLSGMLNLSRQGHFWAGSCSRGNLISGAAAGLTQDELAQKMFAESITLQEDFKPHPKSKRLWTFFVTALVLEIRVSIEQ